MSLTIHSIHHEPKSEDTRQQTFAALHDEAWEEFRAPFGTRMKIDEPRRVRRAIARSKARRRMRQHRGITERVGPRGYARRAQVDE